MTVQKGMPVCGGIAEGRIFYIKRGDKQVTRVSVSDSENEHNRVKSAMEQAVGELQALYEKALPEVGAQGAMIFEIHQMMVRDEDYCESIESIINTQKVNAEFAVAQTSDIFAKMFSEMDDPYMRERSADVRDISNRVIACLGGGKSASAGPVEPAIIAADDLSPSETIQMDKSKILGFVTALGSTTSHTAILSRTMGIPAIIGMGDSVNENLDGAPAIIDGFTGCLYICPDDETKKTMAEKQRRDAEHKKLLEQYKGKPNVTLCGKEILVYSNIGSPSETGLVLKNDSGGIGLFRSEFIFLEADDFPSEERQFEAYKAVAQAMGGKRVIFRTLDIGADKQIDYFRLDDEENPALGIRGIRLCFEMPDVFQTQLRALLRASAFGKVAIMFPMISSVWEVEEAKRALETAKENLSNQGIRFDADVECGIMIETPAAALISDRLAPLVDFFSVGTNDLTQYTLAVDRQNHKTDKYTDTRHDAIMGLIEMSAANARKHGKWIGICGELAADLTLTERFIKMGIDELSVSPAKTLELRRHIRGLRLV